MQYALNLETLALPRNHIQDLTPLQGLPRLTSLDLAENEISELTPLAGLPGLRESNLRELDLGVVRYVGEENFSPVMREPPPGDTYRFAVPVVSADLARLAEFTALAGLEAYWNCLDIRADDSGRMLTAFVQAVEPGGLLALLPQRPAQQCEEASSRPSRLGK